MGLSALAIAAATAATAGTQIYGGMVQSAEAKSQQNMANYNAMLAQQEAKAEEQRSALEQKRAMQAAERRQSALEAQLGAAGAVTTAGAPLLIQAKQAAESELETLMIGYEGAQRVRRAKSEAAMQRAQGKLYGSQARGAMLGAGIGAGTTLLTGFGRYGASEGWKGFEYFG